MSMVAMIGLGMLAWFLLSILLALFVGRLIRLRDQQRPDRGESAAPVSPAPDDRTGAASARPRRRLPG